MSILKQLYPGLEQEPRESPLRALYGTPAAAPTTRRAPARQELVDYIRRRAEEYGIPPELAVAVARAESGFNPRARSPAGAIGVMQLMPGTARALGVDPWDPYQNIEGGLRYLKQQYDRFGDWSLALAAYNAGPGAVQRYGGVPPYRETQNYIRRVLRFAAGVAREIPRQAEAAIGGLTLGAVRPKLPEPKTPEQMWARMLTEMAGEIPWAIALGVVTAAVPATAPATVAWLARGTGLGARIARAATMGALIGAGRGAVEAGVHGDPAGDIPRKAAEHAQGYALGEITATVVGAPFRALVRAVARKLGRPAEQVARELGEQMAEQVRAGVRPQEAVNNLASQYEVVVGGPPGRPAAAVRGQLPPRAGPETVRAVPLERVEVTPTGEVRHIGPVEPFPPTVMRPEAPGVLRAQELVRQMRVGALGEEPIPALPRGPLVTPPPPPTLGLPRGPIVGYPPAPAPMLPEGPLPRMLPGLPRALPAPRPEPGRVLVTPPPVRPSERVLVTPPPAAPRPTPETVPASKPAPETALPPVRPSSETPVTPRPVAETVPPSVPILVRATPERPLVGVPEALQPRPSKPGRTVTVATAVVSIPGERPRIITFRVPPGTDELGAAARAARIYAQQYLRESGLDRQGWTVERVLGDVRVSRSQLHELPLPAAKDLELADQATRAARESARSSLQNLIRETEKRISTLRGRLATEKRRSSRSAIERELTAEHDHWVRLQDTLRELVSVETELPPLPKPVTLGQVRRAVADPSRAQHVLDRIEAAQRAADEAVRQLHKLQLFPESLLETRDLPPALFRYGVRLQALRRSLDRIPQSERVALRNLIEARGRMPDPAADKLPAVPNLRDQAEGLFGSVEGYRVGPRAAEALEREFRRIWPEAQYSEMRWEPLQVEPRGKAFTRPQELEALRIRVRGEARLIENALANQELDPQVRTLLDHRLRFLRAYEAAMPQAVPEPPVPRPEAPAGPIPQARGPSEVVRGQLPPAEPMPRPVGRPIVVTSAGIPRSDPWPHLRQLASEGKLVTKHGRPITPEVLDRLDPKTAKIRVTDTGITVQSGTTKIPIEVRTEGPPGGRLIFGKEVEPLRSVLRQLADVDPEALRGEWVVVKTPEGNVLRRVVPRPENGSRTTYELAPSITQKIAEDAKPGTRVVFDEMLQKPKSWIRISPELWAVLKDETGSARLGIVAPGTAEMVAAMERLARPFQEVYEATRVIARKLFVPWYRELERVPAGRRFVELVEQAERHHSQLIGEWTPFLERFRRLPRHLQENVRAAAEGRAQPANSTVQQLVDEWNRIRQEIAREVQGLQFQIFDPRTQEWRPWQPRQNYWHMMLRRDLMSDKAARLRVERALVDRYVKTGMSREEAELLAQQLLNEAYWGRRFGALEMARTAAIPDEFRASPMEELADYLTQAADAISVGRAFGPHVQGAAELPSIMGPATQHWYTTAQWAGAERLFADIRREASEQIGEVLGRDAGEVYESIAREVLRRFAGERAEPAYASLIRRAAGTINSLGVMAYMSFSALWNLTQVPANAPVRTSWRATLRGLLKLMRDYGDAREFAVRSGALVQQVMDDLIRDITGTEAASVVGKLSRAFVNLNGFMPVERFNRVWAAAAGREWAKDMAARLLRNPRDAYAARQLRSMGIDPQAVLQRRGLSPEDLLNAGFVISRDTNFLGGPMRYPEFWNSPWGQLAGLFKRFALQQTDFIRKQIWEELKKGNVGPLLVAIPTWFALGDLAGWAAAELRGQQRPLVLSELIRWVTEGTPPDRSMEEFVGAVAQNLAGWGAVGMLSDVARQASSRMPGRLSAYFIGPMPSLATDVASAFAQSAVEEWQIRWGLRPEERRPAWQRLKRTLVARIPFVGPRLAPEVTTPYGRYRLLRERALDAFDREDWVRFVELQDQLAQMGAPLLWTDVMRDQERRLLRKMGLEEPRPLPGEEGYVRRQRQGDELLRELGLEVAP